MASEKKKYNIGEHISRYEPTHMQDINASSFTKTLFEDVGCLWFCEKIQEVGCHAKLTNLSTTNFKRDKTTIAEMDFIISVDFIASTTSIPNQGEI